MATSFNPMSPLDALRNAMVEAQDSTQSKASKLISARDQKLQALQIQADKRQQELDTFYKTTAGRTADSWNLPDNHGALDPINAAAAAAEATGKIKGALDGRNHQAFGQGTYDMIDDPRALESYARYLHGEATSEDMEILSKPYATRIAPLGVGPSGNGPSRLEALQQADKNLDYAKNKRDNAMFKGETDRRYAQDFQNDFNEGGGGDTFAQMGEGWDGLWDPTTSLADNVSNMVSGAARMLGHGARAAVNNPAGALGIAAEQLPQIIGSMIPGVAGAIHASSLTEQMGNYTDGVRKSMKEDGTPLTLEERGKRALWGVGAAAADVIGDRLAGGALGGDSLKRVISSSSEQARLELLKKSLPDVDPTTLSASAARQYAQKAVLDAAEGKITQEAASAVVKAVSDAFPVQSNAAALMQALGSTVAGAGKAVPGEMGTEMLQTYAEAKAKGEEASNEDIAFAGAVGGLLGGTLGGIGGTIQGASDVLSNMSEASRIEANSPRGTSPEVAKAVDLATTTGNVDSLLDMKSKTYAPVEAVKALAAYTQQPNITPEQRVEAETKMESAVKELTAEAKRSNILLVEKSPTAWQEAYKAAEDKAKSTDPTTAESGKNALKFLETLKGNLTENDTSPEVQKINERIRENENNQKQAADILRAQRALKAGNTNIVSALESITPASVKADPAKATESVRKVLGMIADNPSAVTSEIAKSIAANTDLQLTDSEREFFSTLATLEEGKQGEWSKVSHEAVHGSDRAKGIVQHHDSIMNAITLKDKDSADSAVQRFASFAELEDSKAQAFARARELIDAGTYQVRVARDPNTKLYAVAEVNDNRKVELKSSYASPVLHKGSSKLWNEVDQEVNLASSALRHAAIAYEMAFGSQPPSARARSRIGTLKPEKNTNTATASTKVANPTTPAQTTATKSAFAAIADTDDIYNRWSNVRDGSDRSIMSAQIKFAEDTYKGKVTSLNRNAVKEELRIQFNWFKSLSAAEKDAAVDALQTTSSEASQSATPATQTSQIVRTPRNNNKTSTDTSAKTTQQDTTPATEKQSTASSQTNTTVQQQSMPAAESAPSASTQNKQVKDQQDFFEDAVTETILDNTTVQGEVHPDGLYDATFTKRDAPIQHFDIAEDDLFDIGEPTQPSSSQVTKALQTFFSNKWKEYQNVVGEVANSFGFTSPEFRKAQRFSDALQRILVESPVIPELGGKPVDRFDEFPIEVERHATDSKLGSDFPNLPDNSMVIQLPGMDVSTPLEVYVVTSAGNLINLATVPEGSRIPENPWIPFNGANETIATELITRDLKTLRSKDPVRKAVLQQLLADVIAQDIIERNTFARQPTTYTSSTPTETALSKVSIGEKSASSSNAEADARARGEVPPWEYPPNAKSPTQLSNKTPETSSNAKSGGTAREAPQDQNTSNQTGLTTVNQASNNESEVLIDDEATLTKVMADIARNIGVLGIIPQDNGKSFDITLRYSDTPKKPIARFFKQITHEQDVALALGQRLREVLVREGKQWPTNPEEMTRDQFVVAYQFGNIIPEFELSGDQIGADGIVRPNANGTLTVSPDALYDEVMAQAKSRNPHLPDPNIIEGKVTLSNSSKSNQDTTTEVQTNPVQEGQDAPIETSSREEVTSNEEVVSEANQEVTSEEVEALNDDRYLKAGDSGALSALNNPEPVDQNMPIGKIFENPKARIKVFLKQAKQPIVEGANAFAKGATRPLVAVPNFLSKWLKGEVDPNNYVKKEMSDAQYNALDFFQDVAVGMVQDFKQIFIPDPNVATHKFDMGQDLLAGDVLDENIYTAMAYSAVSWINEAVYPTPLTVESVLAMHGINAEHDPSANITIEGFLFFAGTLGTRGTIIRDLGQRASNALGLKLTERAPKDYLKKIEYTLGTHIFDYLDSQGYFKKHSVAPSVLDTYISSDLFTVAEDTFDKHGNVLNTVSYYSLASEGVNQEGYKVYHPDVETVRETLKDSKMILDQMFGYERMPNNASEVPLEFEQVFAKRTDRKITKEQREILEPTTKHENKVHVPVWRVLESIGDAAFLRYSGFDERPENSMHVTARPSIVAKNEGLVRELNLAKNLVNNSTNKTKQSWFVPPVVWKNFRTGLGATDLNMQSSKIHRFLFTRPQWENTIDTSNPDDVALFKLDMAASLGINPDNDVADGVRASLDAMLEANPAITHLAKKLHEIGKENSTVKLSPEEMTDLDSVVLSSGEGLKAIQALQAYGAFLEAENNPTDKKFKYAKLAGSDGKTSGPILSMAILGAASSLAEFFSNLNRGGIFQQGSPYKNFGAWKKEGAAHQDLYQYFGSQMLSMIPHEKLSKFYYFTGELMDKDGNLLKDGRNIVKTPLTSFWFGSTARKSVEGMVSDFKDSIYKKIEKVNAITDPIQQEEQRVMLIDSLNQLLEEDDLIIPKKTTITQLMQSPLSFQQLQRISGAFAGTVYKPVEETLKELFGSFILRRQAVNLNVQTAAELYILPYQKLYAKEMQRLMDEGHIAYTTNKQGQKIPMHDMSELQEKAFRKEIDHLLPKVHSAFSIDSGNIDEGFVLLKSAEINNRRAQDKTTVRTPSGLTKAKSQEGYVPHTIDSRPGVAGLPWMTHSLDVAGMLRAIRGTQDLNIHDEGATGVMRIPKTAKRLNEMIYRSMIKYSPMEQGYKLLERQLENLEDLMEQGLLSDVEFKKMLAQLRNIFGLPKDTSASETLRVYVDYSFDEMRKAKLLTLDALATTAYVDQYTWEGGEYAVTDKDRADVLAYKEQWLKENKTPSEKLLKVLDKVDALAKKLPKHEDFVHKYSLFDAADVDKAFSNAPTIAKANTVQPKVETRQISPANAMSAAFVGLGKPAVMQGLVNYVSAPNFQGSIEEAVDLYFPFEYQASMNQEIKSALNNAANNLPVKPTQTMNIRVQDAPLVDFLERNPETTVGKLAEFLMSMPHGEISSPQTMEYLSNLLRLVRHEKFKNFPVRYMLPSVAAKYPAAEGTNNFSAYASIDSQTNRMEVRIRPYSTKIARVTSETVVHEILHTLLMGIIETETKLAEKDPSYSSEALVLVRNLQKLHAAAKDYVARNPENIEGFADIHAYALSDIHEFTSMGMSNARFQTEVLEKLSIAVTYKHNGKENSLLKGLKGFIDTLAGLLSSYLKLDPATTKKTNNGLRVMVTNVTGLIAQAHRDAEASREYLTTDLAGNDMRYRVLGMQAQVDRMSSADIFENLSAGNLGNSAVSRLRQIQEAIIGKIVLPFGQLWEQLSQTAANTATDVWTQAQVQGFATFGASAMAVFPMTDREGFVADQVYAAMTEVLKGSDVSQSPAYKALEKVFNAAQKHMKPEDFDTPEQYNVLFNIALSDGKSDHLARFAALALGNEDLAKRLGFHTGRTNETNSLWGRILSHVESIFHSVQGNTIGLNGNLPANQQVMRAVKRLVDLNAREKNKIKNSRLSTIMGAAEGFGDRVTDRMRSVAVGALDSSIIAKSRFSVVRNASKLGKTVAEGHTDQFVKSLFDIRNNMFKEKYGMIAEIMQDLAGNPANIMQLLRAQKMFEGKRHDLIRSKSRQVLSAFKAGEKLKRPQRKAVTSIGLRTGLHNLTNRYSLQQINNMIRKPDALNAEIQNVISRLNGPTQEYTYLANVLGHYLATGKVKGLLFMNADVIARKAKDDKGQMVSEDVAQANAPTLRELITLFALRDSKDTDKEVFADLFTAEINRGAQEGNGVDFLLRTAKFLEGDALERNFNGNSTLMLHGFTPEITNPNTAFATVGEEDLKRYKDLGYQVVNEFVGDPMDPARRRVYSMILKGGGLAPWVSGAISYTGMQNKGARVTDGNFDMLTEMGVINTQYRDEITNNVMRRHTAQIKNLPADRDLNQDKQNYLAPIMNEDGEIVDWRYMMPHETKDTALQRNNDFSQLIGMQAGNVVDKETTPEQNKRVFEALKTHYDSEYQRQPNNFVAFGPNATDPELKQIWKMLPDRTKRDVRRIWGSAPIYIPKGSHIAIFGYRAPSLAGPLARVVEARQQMESQGFSREDARTKAFNQLPLPQMLYAYAVDTMFIMAGFVRGMNYKEAQDFAQRAAPMIFRFERGWQEVVRVIKDAIVVKNVITLLGNIFSNMTYLVARGVLNKQGIIDQFTAVRGFLAYRSEYEELMQLQTKLDIGLLTGTPEEKVLTSRINQLEDSIARNPVTKLVDEGLLPTIAEDVRLGDDPYAYSSWLGEKAQKYTDKLPSMVRTVGKHALLTHDTKPYQWLSNITQMSDFVARYALYQNLTQDAKKPLSHSEAITEVMDAFVYYDLPMQRNLQYLDDMGITMFTKYTLRSARVITKLFKDHPYRTMLMHLGVEYLNFLPSVLDGYLLNHIGDNPFNWGAFQLPSAVGGILPISGVMSLVK